MINLLPVIHKQEINAGRVNVLLKRYVWLLLMLFAVLGVFIAFTYLVLQGIKTSAEHDIAANDEKSVASMPTRIRANNFQANLTTAKSIFAKQTNYTSVILEISSRLPAGVILENISLDAKTFGTPMELRAKAKSNELANTLKESLESSDIFSDVKFKSLTNVSDSRGYNTNVAMQVTLKKEVLDHE